MPTYRGTRISSIYWIRNYKYMYGSVEIPKYKLNQELSFTQNYDRRDLFSDKPLVLDRGTMFSEIEIPGVLNDYNNFKYALLRGTYSDGGSVKIYAWVVSVEQSSTSAQAVRVRFAVDHWRTYNSLMTFGRGTVERCGNAAYKRPRSLLPRYRKISAILPLNDNSNDAPDSSNESTMWVILLYTITVNSVSSIRRIYFPVALAGGNGHIDVYTNGAWRRTYCPSLYQVYYGKLDEAIGIDPDTVIAAYLSPICPRSSSTICYYEDSRTSWACLDTAWDGIQNGNNYWGYVVDSGLSEDYTISLSPAIQTDDVNVHVITDFQGNIAGSLPYGLTCSKVILNTDTGPAGGYLNIAFVSDAIPDNSAQGNNNVSSKLAGTVGCAFTVPLPTVPITTNAKSSYVMSGQRDYDIEVAEIARNQQAVNGITGAATTAIGGALTGAMVGAAGGPIGAGVGAAVGAIGGVASIGINYLSAGYFNDRLQDAKDELYANQANTLLLTGSSYLSCMRYASGDCKSLYGALLITLTMDSVSKAEYDADIAINGYEVQIPAADCTSFIDGVTGPVRISGLNVYGTYVPPESIQYVRDMFARGVYLTNKSIT